jgi:hypothetical protein
MKMQPSSNLVYRQKVIVWAVMALSVALLFMVKRLVPPEGPVNVVPGLVLMFTILAVALVLGSFLLRGRWLARPSLFLVQIVLCDAAAMMGFVVWYAVGSSRSDWLMLLGFVGILLHFPRREG